MTVSMNPAGDTVWRLQVSRLPEGAQPHDTAEIRADLYLAGSVVVPPGSSADADEFVESFASAIVAANSKIVYVTLDKITSVSANAFTGDNDGV